MKLDTLSQLERRALAAYVVEPDATLLPGTIVSGVVKRTVRALDGTKHKASLRHVWLIGPGGVLACYRVKERERGETLTRLRRWPEVPA